VPGVSRYVGLSVVFLWFAIGGIEHFVATDLFASIVPPYVPFARPAVYLSGVLELLGAVGICLPHWRRWAGRGLFALTLAVTPANIYMWQHADLFPTIDPRLLFLRLPLQAALLALIWWSTRMRSSATESVA
jgi:uncharacterized membrane protein